MDKSKTLIFIIITAIVVLVLIIGILAIVFQYRKRKLTYQRETDQLNEEHSRELLASRLLMQQQTMQFIGREIHDSVGQKLTLVSLYLQQWSHRGHFNGEDEKMGQINSILNESLQELRNLSKSLTDETIQQQNFTKLLLLECERINASGVCHASLSNESNGDQLHLHQKSILLRITQEFIQNSLKHSGCRNIDMVTENGNRGFTLTLKDDGIGFDLKQTGNTNSGIGLSNIQRRAQSIGATATMNSEAGMGTQLIINLPLTV